MNIFNVMIFPFVFSFNFHEASSFWNVIFNGLPFPLAANGQKGGTPCRCQGIPSPMIIMWAGDVYNFWRRRLKDSQMILRSKMKWKRAAQGSGGQRRAAAWSSLVLAIIGAHLNGIKIALSLYLLKRFVLTRLTRRDTETTTETSDQRPATGDHKMINSQKPSQTEYKTSQEWETTAIRFRCRRCRSEKSVKRRDIYVVVAAWLATAIVDIVVIVAGLLDCCGGHKIFIT